jgi:hypothetical protein
MKAIRLQILFLFKTLIRFKHILIITPIFTLILIKIIRILTTMIFLSMILRILN